MRIDPISDQYLSGECKGVPLGFFVHKMKAIILLTDKSEGYPGWGCVFRLSKS